MSAHDATRRSTISVLVPTYRRPDEVRRCLDALLSQSRRPEQIVVVVRDTDAETRSMVGSYPRRTAAGVAIDTAVVTRPGMLSALNAGLPLMTGDVLCFTDDDAEPFPDWLERIERWYDDPTVVGVGGRDLLVNQPQTIGERCRVVGHCTWYGRVLGNHHLSLDPPRPIDACVLKGVNMSYRRTSLQGFRFDERMSSSGSSWNELDAAFFVRRGGGRLIYDPEVRVHHYASPRPEWGREEPIRLYDGSHNYTYVMLKHLSWSRRLVFLLYVFLVGQRVTWGPITVMYELIARRRAVSWAELRYSLTGKCGGVRSFLGWWREARAARTAS